MKASFLGLALVACASGSRPAGTPPDVGTLEPDASVTGDGPAACGEDDHQCGASCRDCTVCGGVCDKGECTPGVLADHVAPVEIAVDATRVYWQDVLGPDPEHVFSVAKTGGALTTLAADNFQNIGLTIDDNFVYWDHESSDSSGAVMRVPIAGGTASIVAATLVPPAWLMRSGTTLVWEAYGLFAGPISGGSITMLDPVHRQIDSIATTADRVFYATRSETESAIRSVPLAGGPSSLVEDCYAVGIDNCEVAIANDRICIGSNTNHTIETASPPGAALETVANPQVSWYVTADATSCYWQQQTITSSSTYDWDVMKVDVATGQISRLATSRNGTGNELIEGGMAVDDHCVYYGARTFTGSALTGGRLLAVQK